MTAIKDFFSSSRVASKRHTGKGLRALVKESYRETEPSPAQLKAEEQEVGGTPALFVVWSRSLELLERTRVRAQLLQSGYKVNSLR